jgi:hypothetical protein
VADHGATSDTMTTNTTTSTANESESSSTSTDEPKADGIEDAVVVDPDVERFGYKRWHLLVIEGLIFVWVLAPFGLSDVFLFFLAFTTALMYVDILVVREATTWQPKAWLYVIGMLAFGIGGILYVIHRYRVWPESFPKIPIVSRFRN